MKIRLRLTALMLAVLMSAAALVSCRRNDILPETEPPETTSGTGNTVDDHTIVKHDYKSDAKSRVDALPEDDFGGESFIIVTPRRALMQLDDAMEKDSADALEYRNSLVSEKYNISFDVRHTDADSLYKEVRQSVKAGAYYADIITPPEKNLGTYIVNGLLTDLAADGSGWTEDYLGGSAVKSASGANSVYAVGGDLTLNPESAAVLYFNKAIMSSLGLESPYALVRRGEWTWDKYYEYAAALVATNTAREEAGEEKLYTYSVQSMWEYICDAGFISSGGMYVNSGVGATPTLWVNSDNTEPIIDKIKPFVDDPDANGNRLTSTTDFTDGKSLFLIDTLETARILTDSDISWGILPFPKYSAEQESYHTLLFPETAYLAASPSFEERAPMVRTVLRALCAASDGLMRDAYVNEYMNYVLRDMDSADMMEMILKGGKYDMAYVLGDNNMYISSTTYYGVRSALDKVYSVQRFLDMWLNGTNAAFEKFFPMPVVEE